MNKAILLLTLITSGLLLMTATAHAQETNSCRIGGTAIVFGNGINTSKPDAKFALAMLETKIRLSGILTNEELENEYIFDLSYNPTDGFAGDLWESTKQDLAGDVSQFWRYLAGLDIMPEWFSQRYVDSASELDDILRINTPAAQAHADKYNDYIQQGRRVIPVVHSQGNFYFNSSYTGVDTDNKGFIQAVSVANPDNTVAGAGSYTTETRDLVILSIKTIKEGAGLPESSFPLPGNVTNTTYRDFPISHNFVKVYMKDLAGDRVISHLSSVIASLPFPEAELGIGAINITLRWDNQPDNDLHVWEPNGTHVFYSNRQGPSGFLDVDDTNGNGPENYFVSCDTLETGIYQVGVNYYNGSGDTQGTVRISAGLSSRTKDFMFTTPLFSSGNNPPRAVNIIVFKDENDVFDFIIEENGSF
jgi:hypothetical protein